MTSNCSKIKVEEAKIKYKNVNIAFYILRISTTLYLTYQLLYRTGYIQMRSNYSKIEVETEEIEYKYWKVTFSILTISTTLYHTYQLSYYEGYIQMTTNYSTTEVEAGEIEYKNETWHSLYLGFLLTYIICINHYIVQDTFRWEATTAQ